MTHLFNSFRRGGLMRRGVFAPDSAMWRINRERFVLIGGPAAAILQAAHPSVAFGVAARAGRRAAGVRIRAGAGALPTAAPHATVARTGRVRVRADGQGGASARAGRAATCPGIHHGPA